MEEVKKPKKSSRKDGEFLGIIGEMEQRNQEKEERFYEFSFLETNYNSWSDYI